MQQFDRQTRHQLGNACGPRLGPWAGAIAVGLWAAIAPVARALAVRVSPPNPQLGHTISAIVETDDGTPPTVTFNGTAYPAYPLGPNRYRALIPTTPLDRPGAMTLQVRGDGETRNLAIGLQGRSFPTQSIWLRGGGSNATETELAQVAQFKTTLSDRRLWNGPFLRPTSGRVSTVFGVRRYYNGEFAEDYYHRGVDYAAGTGTPVVAPAAGRVVLIGRESAGFRVHGNTVGLDHGQGVLSIFLHLSRIDVREGQTVSAGQRLGAVGSTGASTGPHLHWGLYVHGQAVDPVPWRFEGLE